MSAGDPHFQNLVIERELQRDGRYFVTPVFSAVAPPKGGVASWNVVLPGSLTEPIVVCQRLGNAVMWGEWQEKFYYQRFASRSVPKDAATNEKPSIESPTRWQLRFLLPEGVDLRSVGMTFLRDSLEVAGDVAPSAAWGVELAVPPLSQLAEDDRVSEYPYSRDGRVGNLICSPTCLAMVYAFHGTAISTLDVARAVYDSTTQLYGVWALNTASASVLIGAEGYVVCASALTDIEGEVLRGRPVVTSIAWNEGELQNASQPKSAGHLVVVAGFTTNGNVVVYDPNTREVTRVRRVLDRQEFFAAWTRRSRACYVIAA